MRIIGEFDIDQIKVTIFKMNEKLSVKFEYNLLEQTYKFRDGSGINSIDDVKMFCDSGAIARIKNIFEEMAGTRSSSVISIHPTSREFDIII